jgi:hypothetical protein
MPFFAKYMDRDDTKRSAFSVGDGLGSSGSHLLACIITRARFCPESLAARGKTSAMPA